MFKSHNAFNRKAPLPVGAVQNVARLYEEQKDLSELVNHFADSVLLEEYGIYYLRC